MSMPTKLLAQARRDLSMGDDHIELRLALKSDDSLMAAQPVLWKTHEHGTVVPPALALTNDQAQVLMDELWSVGVRPMAAKGSAGQLAAVQAHLDDMRALTFHHLGVPKK